MTRCSKCVTGIAQTGDLETKHLIKVDQLLNDSLSILIPVHNAQATLTADITRLLEVAAELTSDFDVLVLDDGSSDGTEEIAWDLTTRFSHVSYIRYPEQRGLVSALRAGLAETRGEFVVVCNTERRLSWDNLSRLWATRHHSAMTDEASANEPRWLKRLMQWGQGLKSDSQDANTPFTMRLLHRDDIAAWNALDSALGRPYLERLRKREAKQPTPMPAPTMPAPVADNKRLDSADAPAAPAWVNIAGHVQDFALGE